MFALMNRKQTGVTNIGLPQTLGTNKGSKKGGEVEGTIFMFRSNIIPQKYYLKKFY